MKLSLQCVSSLAMSQFIVQSSAVFGLKQAKYVLQILLTMWLLFPRNALKLYCVLPLLNIQFSLWVILCVALSVLMGECNIGVSR